MSPPSLRHPARLAGASLLRLQSDERLAALAADGHEAAFDAIVDRYRTPLTRYCAGVVGPSRAEDAVQQTLINAHDALKRTDEVRHLRSWLYRIAHNASLNVLRTVRDDVSLDAAADAVVPVADGPAAAFERSERFRATVDALRELPERQRAALVLRELEGRSHEEIAETLGVTKGSARQHLMRARVAVRGAVTAITPYPLVVRLAEMVASPGAAGWTDAAVGAGAGATLAKLTAGVAATGALVGGAVGTERVVHHHRSGADAAERSPSGEAAGKPRVVKTGVVALPAGVGRDSGGSGSGSGSSGSGSSGRGGSGSGHGSGKDDGRDDHDRDGSSGHGSGSGSAGSGRDDSGGSRGRGRGGSGTSDGSGRGSGGSDDSSGSGSGRSGRGSKGGSGGSGSSGSGSSGSGSSGSGSSGSRSGSSGSGSGSSGSGSGGSHSSGSGKDGGSRSESSGSGSGSSGSGSGGDDGSPTSGGGSGDDGSSGSGSGRDSGTTTTAATAPTPTPTTSSGSGSGDSGSSGSDDDSGSSDRSGSN